jgi:endonuclease V-like protein UPF0215 family
MTFVLIPRRYILSKYSVLLAFFNIFEVRPINERTDRPLANSEKISSTVASKAIRDWQP